MAVTPTLALQNRNSWRLVLPGARFLTCLFGTLSPAEKKFTTMVEDEAILDERGSKILTLIRHGESEYNHWRRASFLQLQFREMIKQDPGRMAVCWSG